MEELSQAEQPVKVQVEVAPVKKKRVMTAERHACKECGTRHLIKKKQ